MHEALKRLVLRALRVPPQPQPPAGSPESIRVFRASRNYYYYNLFRWGLKQLGALFGILVLLFFTLTADVWSQVPWETIPAPEPVAKVLEEIREEMDEDEEDEAVWKGIGWFLGTPLFTVIEILGIAFLFLQAPVTYTMVRLDYEMRWYIVTDRSLRIREGVASVREMTMTFANVQNLSIRQGPIQRLLRISDLRVRTAGGGSGDEDKEDEDKGTHSLHLGYLRGVDNAREIRDSILARLRRLKDSGLGDPDDAPEVPTPVSVRGAGTVAAARELLDEARALRRSLGG